ncbi:MAG TPA: hypothetical protein VIE43_08235 [Thermoanaerobaculia bacterium]|jgi:hypothetical protein|nr:hypothetical protein [Thermoanaerobaculia bacterium]
MICPKCGFEQSESPECLRCGVIVARYKGPVNAVAAPAAAAGVVDAASYGTVRVVLPPPAPPVADSIFREAPTFKEPAATADAGSVYSGPTPGSAGTVYQGPAPGSPEAAAMAVTAAARRSSFSPVFGVTRKLGVGDVLNESFAIYLKNIIPFVLLTAIAYSPVYFFAAFLTKPYAVSHPAAAVEGKLLVAAATLLLCLPISTAGITYGVFQQMRGRDASLGTCLSVGFSSLPPVVAVAFLQSLFEIGAAMLTVLPVFLLIAGMMGGGSESSKAWGLVLAPLLLVAFAAPLLLWLRYYVAIPAAVEERPGAMDSLRRSSFLTAGHRGQIFWIAFVLGALNIGMQWGAGLVPVAGPVLAVVGNLIFIGLSATTCAVIYYRLRSFHESIDVDQIASVFA